MTEMWSPETVLCNIIVITLNMPGWELLLWGAWLTDSLSSFLQHPALLPSQAGFAWTAPSQSPGSRGLLIQACSCKERDAWNRWLCLQDSPSAWWKLQQHCVAVWKRPLLSFLSPSWWSDLYCSPSLSVCFSRFLSASFTAVASSKPLACLGVHLVEELDWGMVIIIIESE